MQREARTQREWGQWPGRRLADQGGRDRLRALFTPSDGTEDPPSSNGDDVAYAALSRAYVELDDRERRVSALQDELHALLREDAAELDRRQAELDGRAAELEDRRRAIEAAETTLADRRRELGAVELRRAAVERREEVARTREIALEQRAEELAALARRLTELGGSLVGAPEGQQEEASEHEHVVLEAADGYRLHVRSGPHPRIGAIVELDDGARLCTAVTRSPFPLDARRCAVVERVAAATQPSQASSSASPKNSAITAPVASAGT
jgi:Skp family chaperone for outer membrane proteins